MPDRNPYAERTDGNQQSLVRELRSCGVRVEILSSCGMGIPDILCLFRGLWIPIEIKSSEKEQLTPMEEEWWGRLGIPPQIAWDLESTAKYIPGLVFSSQGKIKFKRKKK